MIRVNGYRAATAMFGLLGLLLAGAAQAGTQRPEDLGVIPTPQEVAWSNDSLRVDEATKILLPATRHRRREIRRRVICKSVSAADGVEAPDRAKTPAAATAPKLIAIGNPKTDPRVARVDEGLRSGTDRGDGQRRLRARHRRRRHRDRRRKRPRPALRHRDPAADVGLSRSSAPLPAVRVRDWPKMAMRGVHDEFSYGQVSTMDNFKDMIRFLADYKMNTLIFYFEDTFRFKRLSQRSATAAAP